MRRRTIAQRATSLLLAVLLLLPAMANVRAAIVPGPELLGNTSLEEEDVVEKVPGDDNYTPGKWYLYNCVREEDAQNAHTGSYAAKLNRGDQAIEQDVSGMVPGGSYTATV